MGGIGDTLRESRASLKEVFANRNLRRINFAFAGSIIGDGAQGVGAAVFAYRQGGATAVGVISVVRFLAMSFTAPFAAMLVDKFDRKRVMVAADIARAVLVLCAAAIIFKDGPALAVYAIAVMTSMIGTAFRPAQASLMPTLANHPGELTAANVVSSTIESVGFFAGPAIGGILLAVADIPAVYVFNAVSFVWSAAMVVRITTAAASTEPSTDPDADGDAGVPAEVKKGFLHELSAGYRTILTNRDLRLLVGLFCLQTIVAGASAVYEVAIALDLLKTGDSGVGVMLSALGVGGFFGGFIALVAARRNRLALDFGVGVALWGAPLLIIAIWPTLPAALAAMALIGVGNSLVDINAFTILQRLVPDEVMGRVFGALESAIIGGMGVGALLMPVLIHTIGLRSGLVVLGSVVVVVVVVGSAGLNRIDRTALAPVGLELFRGVPMLGVLPELVLERLARSAVSVSVAVGDAVFREGDDGDRFYVIESGSAEVSIGGEFVRTVTTGGSFGEIALLRDVPRTATVVATSDLTLRAIEREHFLPAVTGHGAAADEADQLVNRLLTAR
jgi:MFS family permease